MNPVPPSDSFGGIPRNIIERNQLDDSLSSLISDFHDSVSIIYEEEGCERSGKTGGGESINVGTNVAAKQFYDTRKSLNNSISSQISSTTSTTASLSSSCSSLLSSSISSSSSSSRKKHGTPALPRIQRPKSQRQRARSPRRRISENDSIGEHDSFRSLISDFGDSSSTIFEEDWQLPNDEWAPAADPLHKFKSDTGTSATQRSTSSLSMSSSTTSLSEDEDKQRPVGLTALPRKPKRRRSISDETKEETTGKDMAQTNDIVQPKGDTQINDNSEDADSKWPQRRPGEPDDDGGHSTRSPPRRPLRRKSRQSLPQMLDDYQKNDGKSTMN